MYQEPNKSPWGAVQTCDTLCPGVFLVSTASHGGTMVSNDMLGKCWTGAYCRYFREAVLPLDPVLAASICEDGPAPDTRLCAICGRPFLPEGRQAYCSEACKAEGNRRRSRERMRKKRDKNK